MGRDGRGRKGREGRGRKREEGREGYPPNENPGAMALFIKLMKERQLSYFNY